MKKEAIKRELTDEEKAKEAKRLAHREWQRKNPDKVKAYQMKHYLKKYKEMEKKGEV